MLIKTYIRLAAVAIVASLIASTAYFYKESKRNANLYSLATNNYKASMSNNSAYKLTIEQLKYEKDSITYKLDSVRTKLKIKDSKLQSALYIKDSISIKDSIVFKDSILCKGVNIDTTMVNRWYTLSLKLQYPNKISTSIEMENEKYVLVSTKRETIAPPKRFFLLRWFQKKQTIVQVDIEDSNPYIKQRRSKYIEIVK